MPLQFTIDHFFTARHSRPQFVQIAPIFADIVIRCVRFAFAKIPARIGAVFFSKPVALPFMRFRMLRHGLWRSPIYYEEVRTRDVAGVWMVADRSREPDIVLYYCHGGGFSMGSAYFYMEFLMAWLSLLKDRAGWANPGVFALEYTLVPTATYPTQLKQTLAGYEYALGRVQGKDAARVVVAGDSAGATLQLSLLLSLAIQGDESKKPGFATMVSPWCELVSEKNKDTPSDYLNADSLHLYAREYVGQIVPVGDINTYKKDGVSLDDGIASPGRCEDLALWRRACPRFGWHFIFGEEEVFATATRDLCAKLRHAGGKVVVTDEPCNIHAWPVVALFLAETRNDRLAGLVKIVDAISNALGTHI